MKIYGIWILTLFNIIHASADPIGPMSRLKHPDDSVNWQILGASNGGSASRHFTLAPVPVIISAVGSPYCCSAIPEPPGLMSPPWSTSYRPRPRSDRRFPRVLGDHTYPRGLFDTPIHSSYRSGTAQCAERSFEPNPRGQTTSLNVSVVTGIRPFRKLSHDANSRYITHESNANCYDPVGLPQSHDEQTGVASVRPLPCDLVDQGCRCLDLGGGNDCYLWFDDSKTTDEGQWANAEPGSRLQTPMLDTPHFVSDQVLCQSVGVFNQPGANCGDRATIGDDSGELITLSSLDPCLANNEGIRPALQVGRDPFMGWNDLSSGSHSETCNFGGLCEGQVETYTSKTSVDQKEANSENQDSDTSKRSQSFQPSVRKKRGRTPTFVESASRRVRQTVSHSLSLVQDRSPGRSSRKSDEIGNRLVDTSDSFKDLSSASALDQAPNRIDKVSTAKKVPIVELSDAPSSTLASADLYHRSSALLDTNHSLLYPSGTPPSSTISEPSWQMGYGYALARGEDLSSNALQSFKSLDSARFRHLILKYRSLMQTLMEETLNTQPRSEDLDEILELVLRTRGAWAFLESDRAELLNLFAHIRRRLLPAMFPRLAAASKLRRALTEGSDAINERVEGFWEWMQLDAFLHEVRLPHPDQDITQARVYFVLADVLLELSRFDSGPSSRIKTKLAAALLHASARGGSTEAKLLLLLLTYEVTQASPGLVVQYLESILPSLRAGSLASGLEAGAYRLLALMRARGGHLYIGTDPALSAPLEYAVHLDPCAHFGSKPPNERLPIRYPTSFSDEGLLVLISGFAQTRPREVVSHRSDARCSGEEGPSQSSATTTNPLDEVIRWFWDPRCPVGPRRNADLILRESFATESARDVFPGHLPVPVDSRRAFDELEDQISLSSQKIARLRSDYLALLPHSSSLRAPNVILGRHPLATGARMNPERVLNKRESTSFPGVSQNSRNIPLAQAADGAIDSHSMSPSHVVNQNIAPKVELARPTIPFTKIQAASDSAGGNAPKCLRLKSLATDQLLGDWFTHHESVPTKKEFVTFVLAVHGTRAQIPPTSKRGRSVMIASPEQRDEALEWVQLGVDVFVPSELNWHNHPLERSKMSYQTIRRLVSFILGDLLGLEHYCIIEDDLLGIQNANLSSTPADWDQIFASAVSNLADYKGAVLSLRQKNARSADATPNDGRLITMRRNDLESRWGSKILFFCNGRLKSITQGRWEDLLPPELTLPHENIYLRLFLETQSPQSVRQVSRSSVDYIPLKLVQMLPEADASDSRAWLDLPTPQLSLLAMIQGIIQEIVRKSLRPEELETVHPHAQLECTLPQNTLDNLSFDRRESTDSVNRTVSLVNDEETREAEFQCERLSERSLQEVGQVSAETGVAMWSWPARAVFP